MTALSETASAILGLLSLKPESSGYDLGTFAQHSIAHFWPLTRAHIYNELARLERDGYVRSRQVTQDKHPDKRTYTITSDGGHALDTWLDTGAVTPERRRNPLLLKVFFAHRMRPERLAELLADHRDHVSQQRERYARDVAMTDDVGLTGPEQRYLRATAMYGQRRVEAELAWLHDVEQLLLEPRLRPDARQRPEPAAEQPDGGSR